MKTKYVRSLILYFCCLIHNKTNVLNIVFRFVTIFNTYLSVADAVFSLNGTIYHNNSLVNLEDIGDDDTALLCVTNLTACCEPPYSGENGPAIVNWFLPNGTTVPSPIANKSSGELLDSFSEGGEVVVRLNHREGGEEGIYRCEISTSMNVIQTIYIGVYTASISTGE